MNSNTFPQSNAAVCRWCGSEDVIFDGLCHYCWLEDIEEEHGELLRKQNERAAFVDWILKGRKNDR